MLTQPTTRRPCQKPNRIKILLQTQDSNPHILSGRVPRYSFTKAFARLLREQGPAGLWRGNTPYLLRHVPSIALSFTIKDALREGLLPRWVQLGSVMVGCRQ
jgi:solute carrier family 25 (adenine nucleotide translocator) protein 4/5/6/31